MKKIFPFILIGISIVGIAIFSISMINGGIIKSKETVDTNPRIVYNFVQPQNQVEVPNQTNQNGNQILVPQLRELNNVMANPQQFDIEPVFSIADRLVTLFERIVGVVAIIVPVIILLDKNRKEKLAISGNIPAKRKSIKKPKK